MKKIIQFWAIVVSFFAVFTVTGAANAGLRDSAACDGAYCDCAEPCDTPSTPSGRADSRRRHSDIV
jgi:hypothetical protein